MKAKLQNILTKQVDETDIALVKILIEKDDLSILDVPIHLRDKYSELSCISPRQARLILLQYELLDDIEALIATDRALGIWWEYSLDIKRDDTRLLSAATTLGLTEAQLDEMFIEGSKL